MVMNPLNSSGKSRKKSKTISQCLKKIDNNIKIRL